MIAALLLAMVQQVPRDTARDTLPLQELVPVVVTVTRTPQAIWSVPGAVAVVYAPGVLGGRPTTGLDELLAGVPGVYATNRWNFSLDQRVAIRGAGARSSFGIRGIKVLLDGIPQTLPDGSGQLTNVDFGGAGYVEILRGPASALFGNASGGVINISTDRYQRSPTQDVRVSGGALFNKWQSITRLPLGPGTASLSLSRMSFSGQRQHSRADFRNANARYSALLGRTSLAVGASYGDDPRADNPGALTAAELAANRDSAAAINLARNAGKDVRQTQLGASVSHAFDNGELSLAVFGIARRLRNPQTFAYINLDRLAYGARLTGVSRSLPGPHAVLTAGLDLQRQRDDRLNRGNVGGAPDTVRQLDQLETVTELGPFVQLAFDPWHHTTVTIAARYDWVRFSAADRLVTGSNPDDSGRRAMHAPSVLLGAAHRHGAVTIYANVGTSFETPTTTELANRPDTAGGFNASLDPQHALSYEVGVRSPAGSRLRYSASIFRAGIRDALIASQVPSSPGRVFFQNAGRSRHHGVELEVGVALLPGTRVDAAWTWSDFRYTSYTTRGHVLDGRRLPGIPENWVHLTWTARPAFARGAWLIVDQSYSSGFLVDDTLATGNAPWHSLDVRVGWDGAVGRVRVSPFVALNNALDRRYVGSVVINAANGRYYEPAPGRNACLGMTIVFGN